jgi:RNA recognition motif-containing protein
LKDIFLKKTYINNLYMEILYCIIISASAKNSSIIFENEVGIMTTLYVGNLPWTTKSDELREVFSGYGEVQDSRIITDRNTGRSRGFGFVEVSDDDAEKMIAALNGSELGGRVITVSEAKERNDNNA